MKKLTYLLLLLLLPLSSSAQEVIDWDGILDRYIEKYQPTEIPQWLFPLVFENGFGERDTLYLGYDKDANGGNFEAKYGEAYVPVDSSQFKAYWFKCPNCDSLAVVDNLVISAITTIGGGVLFLNGKLPITVHYNDAFFYSDSIAEAHPSFPSVAPYAQGEATEHSIGVALGRWDKIEEEWEAYCGWENTIALMDSTPWGVATPNCSIVPDSFHINNVTPDVFIYTYGFAFTIKKWTGYYVSTDEPDKPSILLYPNPCDEYFSIDLPDLISGKFYLYDALGQLIKRRELFSESELKITSTDLRDGIYFLKIASEGKEWHAKVLVRH